MGQMKKIISYLDVELRISEIPDSSNNGLQVQNSGRTGHICTGVDASMEFFTAAAERRAGLLICHHGISWADSLKRITDMNYRRMKFLMEHDMALYACHLPLDAHPQFGNNALICKKLGLKNLEPFGSSYGLPLGFKGTLPRKIPYAQFVEMARSVFGNISATMDFGKKTVKTAAVISGGGASEIMEAGKDGIDVFVSGEPKLAAYHTAREYGINAVFAGHYATEVFGVRAIAELLADRFSVKSEFIDLETPF